VEPGDQHPQHTQQAKDQERVVEPQPAACIDNHQNECSDERVFACKRARRHKVVTPLVLTGLALLLLLTACAPQPARMQSGALLDKLVLARTMFAEQQARVDARLDDACNVVGSVQTRLYGEPGLSEVMPAWQDLRAAAQALQSVCGRGTLLGQPGNDSQVLAEAHQRWEQGIQREMGVACDYLRAAAVALNRTSPC
jgi:hypothetical protein